VSLSAIPMAMRRRVSERDRGRCQYCHLAQVGQAAGFHIDHVKPKSQGGATEESNLVLQCPHCSLHKSDKLTAIDPVSDETVRLFHPLQQALNDHVALDASGACVGITPVGRATVEALQMNDPFPRIARAIQIGLGLLTPTLP
jgi:hypothetical protein